MIKDKGGRPTKLTEKFRNVFNRVLKDSIKALLTDEKLLFLVNEELEEDEKISNTTFKRWKSGGTKDSKGQEFRSLIKKALIKEEIGLLKEVKEGKLNWQSKAWILERKFDEWNIKHQQEFSGSIAIKGNEIKFKDFDESKPEGE